VSTRRNASLVIALGVGALAATSLAAMVATSELLTESFGRPVSDRLEPSANPDLGRPDVIQVEPPERSRGSVPAGRSRQPAAAPPPRRGPTPGPHAGGSVVVAVQWRPARQKPVAVLPVPEEPASPPAPRPVRPSRPRPAWHRPARPPRPGRRGAGHRPHRHRGSRVPDPGGPRPADPAGEPGGGSPCPDRPRRDGERRGSDDPDRRGRDHRRSWHHRHDQRGDRDPGQHQHRHCHHNHADQRGATRR
jgi:hypothetical protein